MARKKLKIFLILVISIILCLIIAVVIYSRRIAGNPEKFIALVSNGSSVSIGTVHQESVKNGIKEWSLNADSASYFDEAKKVVFKNLSVVFYLKDQNEIKMTADQGVLETGANNIEVSGNIIVTTSKYSLFTDKMFYDNNKRLIFSKTPVVIKSDPFNFTAESIWFDLKTEKAMLEGSVKGKFSETLVLSK